MSAQNPPPANLQNLDFLTPQSLLAAIVDSSDDAIVSKNLDGVVTSWNRGAERIFGYLAEEMIGQPITRVIPADRQNEEPAILERLRRGERIDHFETVRVRKDGSTVDVSLTISPVRRPDGHIVGASKIARDITQHKLAVRKLQEANEALARADRMKVEFISTLSHELRTPLTSIVGWIHVLKDDPQTDDLKQGFEVIERNIRVQTQLINDLLDMSRIETGKMTLDLQRLDLAGAVQAAIDSVLPTAEAKGVRLISTFGNVHGVVMGDRNRMQQIVWNLLTNALKFTPKGGRVHVTIQRVNSHAEIAVIDTGAGIAPEFLSRIFDRFTQADSSLSRKFGGLGIGLSIAKHLTELHGGSISAKSGGLGHGASFCIQLPLLPINTVPDGHEAEQRAAEVDETFREEDLGGIEILVVDDDSDSAAIIARILERKGASVRVANNMDDALREIESATPQILLSDIGMPSHDGYELISRVRQMPQGKKLPAVALTALARPEDRTRSLRAGFQLHVAKPVDAEELVAVVRNLAELSGHE
jgi:PAS domain S-box-containing protein